MAIRTADYVKFIRGNQAAFNALNQKDSNTLYFISEDGASTGSLYLGSKLISGGASESQLGSIVIENLGDKQILYFDYASDSWKNGSIYDAIGPMGGASAGNDGYSGLVPTPKAGQQGLFLRGDGQWAEAVEFNNSNFTKNLSGKVTLLNFEEAASGDILRKSSVGSLEWVNEETLFTAVNSKIFTLQSMIEQLEGGVVRTIVSSTDEIDINAEGVDKYIFMVPKTDTSDTNNLYDEYMVVEVDGVKQIEIIGAGLSGNITGYVTTKTFNTTVGAINSRFNDYVSLNKYNTEVGEFSEDMLNNWTKTTIVEQVDFLTDLLSWYQL